MKVQVKKVIGIIKYFGKPRWVENYVKFLQTISHHFYFGQRKIGVIVGCFGKLRWVEIM